MCPPRTVAPPLFPPTLRTPEVSKAACHFALGEYPKADEEAQKAPPSGLQSRLLSPPGAPQDKCER